MANEVPTPFPDVDRPPRTADQKEIDGRRNEEQTALLSQGPSESPKAGLGVPGPDELVAKLLARRADADQHVVPVEVAPTDNESSSLVVPRQLLVRHQDNNDMLPPDVDQILQNRRFAMIPQIVDDAACPELAGRFSVYTYTSDDEPQRLDDTRAAVTEVREAGGKASPTLVAALHRPGAVVKAAVGPAPTAVDENDEAFRTAGQRQPDGGTVVAVIDTGIADVERSDGWLNEVVRDTGNIDPLDAFPPPQNGYLDFAAGHGTFAAGIVRMVDPDAEIRAYAALDSDGFASEAAIACAMIQAVKDGAHVLSLSLGMKTVDSAPSVAFELALDIIDQIASEPPAIVASAGNYGDDELVWPAAFDRVVSVAGLTADLEPAPWSSYGDWVTCSCVGEGIVSTFVPGDEDPVFSEHHPEFPQPDRYPLAGQRDAWAVWTGTSFAAPQIAGAIARTRREAGNIPPRVAADQLLNQGVDIAGFGKALLLLRGT